MVDGDQKEVDALIHVLNQRKRRPSEPQPISEAISKLMARRGYAHLQSACALLETWNQAVGGRLAECSRPGLVKRGVLEVIVRNSSVLQELTFQKKQILKRLRDGSDLGRGIRGVRFQVGPID